MESKAGPEAAECWLSRIASLSLGLVKALASGSVLPHVDSLTGLQFDSRKQELRPRRLSTFVNSSGVCLGRATEDLSQKLICSVHCHSSIHNSHWLMTRLDGRFMNYGPFYAPHRPKTSKNHLWPSGKNPILNTGPQKKADG